MEVDISGAKVFFTIPIDFPLFGKIQISETLVVSWIVMALITGLCIWLHCQKHDRADDTRHYDE